MAAGGLPVEFKPARLQLPNDLPVSESCEAAHSRGDYDRVVLPVIGSWQVRNTVTLASSFNQFPGDVTRDVERLCYGSPLSNKAQKFIRRRKEYAFGQCLYVYPNR